MLVKIEVFADMVGVSSSTLRKWDKSGKLKAKKILGGNYRYYTEEHLIQVLGEDMANDILNNLTDK